MQRMAVFVALAILAGCRAATETETTQASEPTTPGPSPRPIARGVVPAAHAPLPEPNGPIDPDSAEAAAQVAQHYGALIEQHRFAAATRLWGDAAALAPVAELNDLGTVHSEVGKPFDEEGAAGSIFIEVPFRLFGTTRSGAPFDRAGTLTMRRVNHVDGATRDQLRWHIVQSKLAATK